MPKRSRTLTQRKTATPEVAVSISQEKVLEEVHEELHMIVGPLPDPASYAAYEQTTPGAGERILKMAENEQAHRHLLEDLLTQAKVEDMRKEHGAMARGQWFAFLVAIFLLGVCGLLVFTGHPVQGTALSGITLTLIIASFVRSGRRKRISSPSNK